MYKKILSIVLSMIIITSLIPISAHAADFSKIKVLDNIVDEFGNVHYMEDGKETSLIFNNFQTCETNNSTLPSSYSSVSNRTSTSIKNQSPFGTCWAHTFCAVAESSLISQGYINKTINLSESHLSWFCYNNVDKSSTTIKHDYFKTDASPFNTGGNYFRALGTVSSGSGLTLESDFPYSTREANMQYDYSDCFKQNYSVSNCYILDDDINNIKEEIMKNGAVGASYYHLTSELTSNTYQNKKYTTYYQSASHFSDYSYKPTNHDITIVGWDDTIPSSLFYDNTTKEYASSNGAWLIKNSWGIGWGDSGYFWISYDEYTLSNFYSLDVKPSENLNIYQYDDIGCTLTAGYSGTNSIAAANAFTANNYEILDSVSFYVPASPCSCKIKIYTKANISDNSGYNKITGTLKETQSVSFDSPGYYTLQLNNTYMLSPNEKYVVMIDYTYTNSSIAYFQVEVPSSDDDYVIYAEENQSFLNSSSTKQSYWIDMTDGGYGNLPIKAFTRNVEIINTNISKTEYFTDEQVSTSTISVDIGYNNTVLKTLNSSNSKITIDSQPFSDNSSSGLYNVPFSVNGIASSFNISVLNKNEFTSNSVNINYENNIIRGFFKNEDINNIFNNADFSYEYSDLGTGNILKLYKDDNVIHTFTLLTIGDINGDGWYDATDALLVNCYTNNMLQLSDLKLEAADCNHDNNIDDKDVAILEEAGLLVSGINQNEILISESGIGAEYLALIDQNIEEINNTEENDSENNNIPTTNTNSSKTKKKFSNNIFKTIIKTVLKYIQSIFSYK